MLYIKKEYLKVLATEMKLGSKYDLLDTPGKLNENKVKVTKI